MAYRVSIYQYCNWILAYVITPQDLRMVFCFVLKRKARVYANKIKLSLTGCLLFGHTSI